MTRKMEKAGHKSTGTTNESENYCADHINKKIDGKYFLHGNPDIIFYKNKKFSFYEVKPYKEWIPDKGHRNWNLTSPKRRNLSVAQKKTFRQMIKSGLKVWIIYYNKREDKRKKAKYTILKLRGKTNPRKVTEKVLRNSDPDDYYKWDP